MGKDIIFSFGDKYSIAEMEKDYSRIISSASFRRLQDKTQVFPLDNSDFVRTRLTHSLETSSICKQLWTMTMSNIEKYQKKSIYQISPEQSNTISEALMCAGLLHDIGNPPFGHFGEFSIRNWFKNKLNDKTFVYKNEQVSELLTEQMKSDLCSFEGNSQALRTLTKLHLVDSAAGMNLTSSVLNILIKYPTDSLHIDNDNSDIKKHKLGYYLADKNNFDQITTNTGTYNATETHRHPLTFILEAADDIAYSTGDLEDAYKKGLFTLEEFIAFYEKKLLFYINKGDITEKQIEKSTALIAPLKDIILENKNVTTAMFPSFQKWVSSVRDWLSYSAAFGFAYSDNYTNIMEGKYTNEIISGTFHEYSLKILKDAMVEYVFPDSNIMKLELSAETIITSLLDKFIPAMLYYDRDDKIFKPSKSDEKYINLISDNYKSSYEKCKSTDEIFNLYLRFLLVTDFISGMTDTYAKTLYQELNGI